MSDVFNVFGVRFGTRDNNDNSDNKDHGDHEGDHQDDGGHGCETDAIYFAQCITEDEYTVEGAEKVAWEVANSKFSKMDKAPKQDIGVGEFFRLEINKKHKWTYVCIDLSRIDAQFMKGNPISRIPYMIDGEERSFFTIFASGPDYLILKVATHYLDTVASEFSAKHKGHVIEALPLFFNFIYPDWETTSILIEHEDGPCELDNYASPFGHNGFHPPVRAARLAIK